MFNFQQSTSAHKATLDRAAPQIELCELNQVKLSTWCFRMFKIFAHLLLV